MVYGGETARWARVPTFLNTIEYTQDDVRWSSAEGKKIPPGARANRCELGFAVTASGAAEVGEEALDAPLVPRKQHREGLGRSDGGASHLAQCTMHKPVSGLELLAATVVEELFAHTVPARQGWGGLAAELTEAELDAVPVPLEQQREALAGERARRGSSHLATRSVHDAVAALKCLRQPEEVQPLAEAEPTGQRRGRLAAEREEAASDTPLVWREDHV